MVTQSHSMQSVNESALYIHVTVLLEVLYLDSVFIMVRDVMAQSMYVQNSSIMYRGATRGLSPSYAFGPEIDMYTSMALVPNIPTSHEICQN